MPIILTVALLLVGGTALHAQGSIPGDTLYPVKVHVNENLRDLVSVTARTEASAQLNHAVKRLVEAEKMVSEGRMTEVEKMNLERAFQIHMNLARENIDNLREAGEFTAASDLELFAQNAMTAHRSILVRMAKKTETDLISLVTKVENEQNTSTFKLENIQGRALANADLQSAAQGQMIVATNRLDEARKMQFNKTAGLSSDIQIEARASIAAAQSLYKQAQEEYEVGAYGNALVLFQNAAHVAQGAETLISTANLLNLSKSPESDSSATVAAETRTTGIVNLNASTTVSGTLNSF